MTVGSSRTSRVQRPTRKPMRSGARRALLASAILFGWLAPIDGRLAARGATLIGQPAQSLVVTTLDGKTVDLAKLRGKVVLVNYWAEWCEPCRQEQPALSAFYRNYHDRGLEMIAISVDRPQDRARVVKASKALAYPTAMLKDVAVNGIGAPEGVPLTWVVDTRGIVRDKLIAVDADLLAKVVVPMLPAASTREAKP